MPLPMIPRPKKPKLKFDGWMSLSAKIFEDVVISNDGDTGRSAVGLSKNDETAVDEALFLLVDAWFDTDNDGTGESAGLTSRLTFDFFSAAFVFGFLATDGVSSLAADAFRGLLGVFAFFVDNRASNSASFSGSWLPDEARAAAAWKRWLTTLLMKREIKLAVTDCVPFQTKIKNSDR